MFTSFACIHRTISWFHRLIKSIVLFHVYMVWLNPLYYLMLTLFDNINCTLSCLFGLITSTIYLILHPLIESIVLFHVYIVWLHLSYYLMFASHVCIFWLHRSNYLMFTSFYSINVLSHFASFDFFCLTHMFKSFHYI
jgi:hypothetical protein